MSVQLPPDVQHKMMEYDNNVKAYEALINELQQMKYRLTEINTTIEELKKQPDDVEVYKSVGSILFKSTKAKILEDLEDKRVVLDARIKSTEKHEKTLKERINSLKTSLEADLKRLGLMA